MWGKILFRLLLASSVARVSVVPEDYFERRKGISDAEDAQRAGGKLVLSEDEVKLNTIIMREKRKEFDESRVNGSVFPPAVNFFLSKPNYEESKVFQIIRKMPKGGSLHLHENTLPSLDWIIKNLTYHPNCHMCTMSDGSIRLQYYQTPPETDTCKWELVSDLRQRSENQTAFDESIYDQVSIRMENPETVTNRQIWGKFSKSFGALDNLLTFAGTMKEKMYHVLKEAHEDNVMYLEIRRLSPAYELNGTTRDREYVLGAYKEVVADFQQTHPDFFGVKYIISGWRGATKEAVKDKMKDAIYLRQKYPDDVVGFDIDGYEDRGPPTVNFIEELLYPSTLSPPVDMPFFLHAGETGDAGFPAIYVTVTRSVRQSGNPNSTIQLETGADITELIGHGFALHGHPEVLRLVKQKDIAIEVNPVSNQVLRLISDLRVHPAVSLLAQSYPIVISSDNPNRWGSLPASHDFYAAFMGLGGAQADLKFLKQLAMNSIRYSAMSENEKTRAMVLWRRKWDAFVADNIPRRKRAANDGSTGVPGPTHQNLTVLLSLYTCLHYLLRIIFA